MYDISVLNIPQGEWKNTRKSFNDNYKTCSYFSLSEKSSQATLHTQCTKIIACDVNKNLNELNPHFYEGNVLQKRELWYDWRDGSIFYQPNV